MLLITARNAKHSLSRSAEEDKERSLQHLSHKEDGGKLFENEKLQIPLRNFLSLYVNFEFSTSHLRLLMTADAPVQSNKVDVTKLRRALLEQLHSTSTNYSCLYCHCFLEIQTITIVSIRA